MTSRGKGAARLPEAFVEGLARQLGPAEASRILQGLRGRRPTTLRANTLKSDVRAVRQALWDAGIKVDRVPWCPDALVVKNAVERDLEALPGYREGHFYLQSLSSMVPALVLGPQPGEQILDMAAAPGSKTTQMAALMGNHGVIVANEANPIRAERLRFNLERQGVTIARLHVADGRRLGAMWRARFNRVLLDAPCSGEGRFVAGDAATYRHWSERLVQRLAALQRRLLGSALRAVRPGGVVVYSTCTINPAENEDVIASVLRRYQGAALVEPVTLAIPGILPGMARDGAPPEVRRAVRIMPSATMEGFFVCRLRVLADPGPVQEQG